VFYKPGAAPCRRPVSQLSRFWHRGYYQYIISLFLPPRLWRSSVPRPFTALLLSLEATLRPLPCRRPAAKPPPSPCCYSFRSSVFHRLTASGLAGFHLNFPVQTRSSPAARPVPPCCVAGRPRGRRLPPGNRSPASLSAPAGERTLAVWFGFFSVSSGRRGLRARPRLPIRLEESREGRFPSAGAKRLQGLPYSGSRSDSGVPTSDPGLPQRRPAGRVGRPPSAAALRSGRFSLSAEPHPSANGPSRPRSSIGLWPPLRTVPKASWQSRRQYPGPPPLAAVSTGLLPLLIIASRPFCLAIQPHRDPADSPAGPFRSSPFPAGSPRHRIVSPVNTAAVPDGFRTLSASRRQQGGIPSISHVRRPASGGPRDFGPPARPVPGGPASPSHYPSARCLALTRGSRPWAPAVAAFLRAVGGIMAFFHRESPPESGSTRGGTGDQEFIHQGLGLRRGRQGRL
jgi:hypothetical protein